jgi:hypothetical protein
MQGGLTLEMQREGCGGRGLQQGKQEEFDGRGTSEWVEINLGEEGGMESSRIRSLVAERGMIQMGNSELHGLEENGV